MTAMSLAIGLRSAIGVERPETAALQRRIDESVGDRFAVTAGQESRSACRFDRRCVASARTVGLGRASARDRVEADDPRELFDEVRFDRDVEADARRRDAPAVLRGRTRMPSASACVSRCSSAISVPSSRAMRLAAQARLRRRHRQARFGAAPRARRAGGRRPRSRRAARSRARWRAPVRPDPRRVRSAAWHR